LIEKLVLHKNALLEEMRSNITDEQKQHESELDLNTLYNKVISSTNEECTEKQIKTFIEYTVDLDSMRGQDIRTNLYELWKRFEKDYEYKGRIND
jgi:CHAT domain-containing protein